MQYTKTVVIMWCVIYTMYACVLRDIGRKLETVFLITIDIYYYAFQIPLTHLFVIPGRIRFYLCFLMSLETCLTLNEEPWLWIKFVNSKDMGSVSSPGNANFSELLNNADGKKKKKKRKAMFLHIYTEFVMKFIT